MAGSHAVPFSVLELTRLAGMPDPAAEALHIAGDSDPVFPTRYRITEAGSAAIAASGLAAARLWALRTGRQQQVGVDTRWATAALHSNHYLLIDGAPPPPLANDVTGFYRVKDNRWIFLHCRFANLYAANLSVLGLPVDGTADKAMVAAAAEGWDGLALENAVHAAGGCGGMVRSEAEGLALPQMAAISDLPIFEIEKIGDAPPEPLHNGDRPLSGVRVLDLTRVLAGPTCARTLAEHGADVLKISHPDLPDSGVLDLDTGLGKLSSYIDLDDPAQAEVMRGLIRTGDIFSQSYRPGSLAAKGWSAEKLAQLRPGIIYVTLSAWGHVGPWQDRRGYDTVVQTANGMAWHGENARPAFVPASAQDYVAGYLMAFGAMVALHRRATEGGSWRVRVSLARVGQWIRSRGLVEPELLADVPKKLPPDILNRFLMQTDSFAGQLTHLAPAAHLSETPGHWSRPPVPLGSNPPAWPSR